MAKTVEWNFVKGTHSVTSGTRCTKDATQTLDSGEHKSPYTYSFTFTEAGTFPYICTYMSHCTKYAQIGSVTVQP